MSSVDEPNSISARVPWSKLRVLVTGASGFLGSHLCRCLCKKNSEVHATSRAQRPNVKGEPVWWQTDLEDLGAVRSLISNVKPDIIFHLSGLATADQKRELVLPTFHSLLTSTVNLLTIATEVGCRRVVLAGSLNEPQPDQVENTPTSPYAAAKWASSGYARMFHALYGTPLVIARTFMTYGPGQDSRKVIPSIALSLLKGESPKLSSGQWKADWIYIDDVIEGFLAVAQVPKIEGNTIDLGSGELCSVRGLVEKLVKVVGSPAKPRFGVLPDRLFEPARKADVSDTFEKLGWRVEISLESGLERTVEWYKAQINVSSNVRSTGILSVD